MSKARSQFAVKVTMRRGSPQCEPNPAYPDGIDVNHAVPGAPSCRADLPYPAPERLVWHVRCRRCGHTVAITAAGRPDDPRSITMPCKAVLQ